MSSSDTPKCILLRGDPLYGEGEAGAAITPGMMVSPAGGATTVSSAAEVSVAAATDVAPIFAREMEVIGNGIDDAYADGDTVLLMHCRRGDWVYAFLADGENVSAGDLLSPDGAGAFEAATEGDPGADPIVLPTPVIVRALEAVDNSAGGSAARIKVEVV